MLYSKVTLHSDERIVDLPLFCRQYDTVAVDRSRQTSLYPWPSEIRHWDLRCTTSHGQSLASLTIVLDVQIHFQISTKALQQANHAYVSECYAVECKIEHTVYLAKMLEPKRALSAPPSFNSKRAPLLGF